MAHVDLSGLWHEAAFRLTETYDVTVERGWRIALDQQPYGEVVHVLHGVCRFELGTVAAEVAAGEIGILLPGGRRLTQDVGGEPLRFRGFGFRIERFGAVELTGHLRLPLRLPAPSRGQQNLIAEVVRHGADPAPTAALRARGLAELTVARLVETVGSVASGQPYQRPEIAAALDYMNSHLAEPIDVATLAGVAHLSPKHFARCFREEVGIPPMGYLQALRLSRARRGLATTDLPLAIVATEHGFADAAHFSRAFRRQYGLTPSAYRSRTRSSEDAAAFGSGSAPSRSSPGRHVPDTVVPSTAPFVLLDNSALRTDNQGAARLATMEARPDRRPQ